MTPLKQYRFGFDPWGLLLFLLVMLPNFIWFAVPAPNDILRADSVTPVVDAIGSVFQVLTVACLCFVIHNDRSKLRFSPLIITAIVCVAIYYIGWALYYTAKVSPIVILLLTVPPCLAFILFAIDRKNLPAVLFATVFAVCHLVFAVVNFVSEV
ncbi:MAG: hypothetical protein J6T13_02555 [Bacteroidales bacterium]|nr:hypothetical protein [Bacteroidales bacterium]